MTPAQAATIAQRAQRQLNAGLCAVHITAEELHELSAACLDALERLAQIAALAEAVLYDCGTCYSEGEGHRVREIARLAGGAR